MSSQDTITKPKKNRWYLGGVAGCMAICFTHPLDLLKVHLQTQTSEKLRMYQMFMRVVKNEGPLGLYAGFSASQLRQISYTTARFGLYEVVSSRLCENRTGPLPFYQKIGLSAFSGFGAGIIGSPADMINVRMQNDMKIEQHLRRNYKHAIDGLIRVSREEGIRSIFNGASMTASRGMLMTIGQLAFYEQIKQILLSTNYVQDNIGTHLFTSFLAGTIATIMTQPFDVLKTRMMNANKGQYNGILDLMVKTKSEGLMAFYKGFVPAWTRLGPQTILMWVFLEQLRKLFPA